MRFPAMGKISEAQHPTNEQDNIPVIDPIETQVYEVPGKKFRMIALKMLR